MMNTTRSTSPLSTTTGDGRLGVLSLGSDSVRNNMRMGVESLVVVAHAMGRTLVIPPQQHLYLLTEMHQDKHDSQAHNDMGFEDFYDIRLLRYRILTEFGYPLTGSGRRRASTSWRCPSSCGRRQSQDSFAASCHRISALTSGAASSGTTSSSGLFLRRYRYGLTLRRQGGRHDSLLEQ